MSKYFSSFIDLFFPRTCAVSKEKISPCSPIPISLSAEAKLTEASMIDLVNPEMEKKFMGLFKYGLLMSSYFFVEGGVCQKLVHLAKYKGQTGVFEFYAKQFVTRNRERLEREKIDLVVPVPNHWTKRLKKGYNQAEILSKTMATELRVKHNGSVLKKKLDVSSQTQKNKIERLSRLANLYSIQKNAEVKGKHILLVDDVVTSGATIETCVDHLYKSGVKKVSVYCFGVVR